QWDICNKLDRELESLARLAPTLTDLTELRDQHTSRSANIATAMEHAQVVRNAPEIADPERLLTAEVADRLSQEMTVALNLAPRDPDLALQNSRLADAINTLLMSQKALRCPPDQLDLDRFNFIVRLIDALAICYRSARTQVVDGLRNQLIQRGLQASQERL